LLLLDLAVASPRLPVQHFFFLRSICAHRIRLAIAVIISCLLVFSILFVIALPIAFRTDFALIHLELVAPLPSVLSPPQ
jgi:hypothetical protein